MSEATHTPRVVSHYRLLEPLGEGGMGVVYRAEDLRLGREVAVKLLRTDIVGSANWLERFEREARLASSLHHPHICTIHELGEHEGQPFIAMERLEGVTIRRLIEAGPLAALRVLEFGAQIADALDAAHRRGVIHRDIKPANLFVTEGDQLKILDFGVAKLAPSEESSTQSAELAHLAGAVGADLTRTGVAVGTAAYMSPEQALGLVLDARTDLFSLGSVLYEMATGRRAFGGADVPLVITKIINGIFPPARSVNPAIPEALDAIIQKLLAVHVEDRYQTAADLLADLRAAERQLDSTEVHTLAGSLDTLGGRSRTRGRLTLAGLAAAALLAGVAATLWLLRGSPALTERDSIVIGTIENTTGEAVFDETLVTALKVQLGQSPFLDIVDDQRIAETLRLMGRRPNERLTHDVARDACQRLGVKAMLDGAIAALGKNDVLTLSATDCQTGEIIARAQAEVIGHERVLQELGAMANRMRNTLGESLPSIQRFDVPIEQATTPSLPALKAYALGLDERRRGRELESVAFFNQAIELDPLFASAYGTLSAVYGGLGEWRRSEEYARRAYDLRNRVSERERLFITYQYHDRVTGNQDRAAEALELWKAAYPRDSRPANALALAHNRAGRYEQAEVEAREALRRSPGHPFPLSNLASALRSMARYDAAREVAEEAVRLGVATTPTRRLLYQIGMLAEDDSAAVQVAWSRNTPREFDIVSAQAEVAAFEGRLQAATELYRRAADLAIARRLQGTASGFIAHLAWAEALYREPRDATEIVRRIMLGADTDSDSAATVPRFRAPAALALAGLAAEAQAIVNRAEQRYPEATFVKTLLGPSARAAAAIRHDRPELAIEALRAATATELGSVAGLVPVYLRAEAYRRKGQLSEAIAEYEKLLNHRGVDPFAPMIPLAHLGLARARAGGGDVAGSRDAYDKVLAIWKGADADFPPLVAARAEYDRLIATRERRESDQP